MALLSSLRLTGVSPVTVGGTGTQVKFFPAPPNVVPPSVSALSNQIGVLNVPGGASAYLTNGQHLTVRAGGDFQCPASDTSSPFVTIGMYQYLSGSASNPSFNTLATYQEPASSPGVISVPWTLTAKLFSTTASGLLMGSYEIQVDNGSLQTGAITSVAGVSFVTDPAFSLMMGITFSSGFAGNIANMYQFDVSNGN